MTEKQADGHYEGCDRKHDESHNCRFWHTGFMTHIEINPWVPPGVVIIGNFSTWPQKEPTPIHDAVEKECHDRYLREEAARESNRQWWALHPDATEADFYASHPVFRPQSFVDFALPEQRKVETIADKVTAHREPFENEEDLVGWIQSEIGKLLAEEETAAFDQALAHEALFSDGTDVVNMWHPTPAEDTQGLFVSEHTTPGIWKVLRHFGVDLDSEDHITRGEN